MDNCLWVIVNACLFFSLALLPVLLLRKKNGVLYISRVSSETLLIYLCGILLYCIIDRTDGDYFHLKEELSYIVTHPYTFSGVEPFYKFIAKYTIFSYSLFRTIIWGLALFFYCYCLKTCKLLFFESLWFFVLIALTYFSYPRVSLAICVYLYAVTKLWIDKKPLIALMFFLLSYWLHKSIFLLIFLTPFAYIKLTRIRILLIISISIGLSPLLSKVINIISLNIGGKEVATIMRYASLSQSMGIAEIIQSFLFWFPSAIILFKIVSNKNFLDQNSYYNKLFTLVISILSLSLLVQFSGIGTKFIYTRIREFTIMPMCILFSYYIRKKQFNSIVQICVYLYLLSDIYYMCYRYYLKSIGTGI